MARWLLYALGGGLGHLHRALALARAAAARGMATTVLTNSPFAASVRRLGAADLTGAVSLVRIPPGLDREAVARRVRELLRTATYDTLVVDTFPRGLAGELATELSGIRCPKVLIHRDISPAYVQQLGLAGFVDRCYDRLLLPGEAGPLAASPKAVATEPWLIRHPAALWPRDRVRAHLAVPLRQPLLLVVSSGQAAEGAEMAALARRLQAELPAGTAVRLARLGGASGDAGVAVIEHWPLLELLPGVDVIVGAGGYNTVYEARAARRPLLALARPRRYDRQQRRLRPDEAVRDVAQLIRRAAQLVAGSGSDEAQPPPFNNGVDAAVEAILNLR